MAITWPGDLGRAVCHQRGRFLLPGWCGQQERCTMGAQVAPSLFLPGAWIGIGCVGVFTHVCTALEIEW